MGRTQVIIDLLVNSRDAAGDMDRAAHKFGNFGGAMEGLAGPAGVALAAVGGLAAGAAKAASDMQQASGGVDAVFGTSAQTVHDWAKTSADSVGLAGSAYKTLAAGIGGALTGMGVPIEQATAQTGALITRAADLASVYGGSTQQATEAMTSAFRGEYDSLQRLIPSMSGAAVEAEMAAEAAAGQTFASEEAAKANAIYTLAMDSSAGAAGNFAKEADTAAGAQARAQAKFQDTAAALGEQLLPAITTVMGWLTSLGTWVSEHIPLVTTLAAVIAGLAVAVLAVNAAMAVAAAAQAVATAATAAWSAAAGIGAIATTAFGTAMAILTSPITLVVVAIAAVIAIVVLLVKNWDTVAEAAGKCWDFITEAAGAALDWLKETVGSVLDWIGQQWQKFQDFLSGIWDTIKSVAAAAFDFIKYAALGPIGAILLVLKAFGVDTTAIFETIKRIGSEIWGFIQRAAESALRMIMAPINAVKSAIEWVIQKIREALRWAQDLVSKIPFIGGLFSSSMAPAVMVTRSVTAAAPTAQPRLGTARTRAVAGGITITVNGALDPVGTARQIRALLVAQERRGGGVRV